METEKPNGLSMPHALKEYARIVGKRLKQKKTYFTDVEYTWGLRDLPKAKSHSITMCPGSMTKHQARAYLEDKFHGGNVVIHNILSVTKGTR
jgi:hypothetical protein